MPRTGRPPKPALDRFLAYVVHVDSGCQEWQGHLDRDGYGQFRPAGGRKSSKVRSHRWAYEHYAGPIPEGMVLDHLCRNRACVNPHHLEVVTPRENWLRGQAPSVLNIDKTHCVHGHPLAGDNLRVAPDGKRSCVTCRRIRSAAHYQARKAS